MTMKFIPWSWTIMPSSIGSMNSSFSAGRKIFLLKPVREGKAAARIQELHRRREEFPRIMM